MSFEYNWMFTFKASEIIDLVTTKIEKLRRERDQLQAKIDQPGPDVSPEVEAAIKLLEREGQLPSRVRVVHNKDEKELQSLDVKISKLRRMRALLRREDPHRQYKMTYLDAVELEFKYDDD